MTFFVQSNMKKDILKNVGNQTVSVPTDFHFEDKKYNGSQWEPKYLLLCSVKEVIQVWNGIRVNK